MKVALLVDELNSKYRVEVRIKLFAAKDASAWAAWFTVPVENYIESASTGPYSLREVEWVELNPFVVEDGGRLIMPRMHNYEQQLREALEVEPIRFERVGLVFRVYFT